MPGLTTSMPGAPSGQWRMEANSMTLETTKMPRNGHPDPDTSYPYPVPVWVFELLHIATPSQEGFKK